MNQTFHFAFNAILVEFTKCIKITYIPTNTSMYTIKETPTIILQNI